MSKIIKINVALDVVCPWCFIGKRRLERAIKQFQQSQPTTQFDITWLPYQLDPNSPLEPRPKHIAYALKFGARAQGMISNMIELGKSEDIKFSYEGVTGNTLLAHRLIYLGKQKGVQDQVVQGLLKAYFEQEKNIFTVDSLIELSGSLGLDGKEVADYLNSQQGVQEVKNLINESRAQGITGVPNYIVGDKFMLNGAQDPEQFIKVFNKLV